MAAKLRQRYVLHKLAKRVKHSKCGESLVVDSPIGNWGCKQVLKAMRSNVSVRYFCLERNHLQLRHCELLGELLQQAASSLRVLSLFECQMGPAGGQLVAQGIRASAALVGLSLALNNLGPIGGALVLRAAAASGALETLDLHANNLSSANGADVAVLLQQSTTLATLFLAYNPLGALGAAAIAEALPLTRSLTTLFLSSASLGSDGAVAIAAALEHNRSLTILRLDDNNIGAAGGVAIARALRVNSTLTALGCRKNSVGPEGGAAIMQALRVNTALRFLNLSKNGIGSGTGFSDLLLCNHTIVSLHLVDPTIARDEYVRFVDAVVHNPSLVDIRLRIENPSAEMLASLAEALDRNQHNTLVRRKSLFHLAAIVVLRKQLDMSVLPAQLLRRLAQHFSQRSMSHRLFRA